MRSEPELTAVILRSALELAAVYRKDCIRTDICLTGWTGVEYEGRGPLLGKQNCQLRESGLRSTVHRLRQQYSSTI